MTAWAKPTGTFWTKIGLQSCPELGPEGWAFILLHPSVLECQLSCQRGTWPWMRWLSAAEGIAKWAWQLTIASGWRSQQPRQPAFQWRGSLAALHRVPYNPSPKSIRFKLLGPMFNLLHHLVSAYYSQLLSNLILEPSSSLWSLHAFSPLDLKWFWSYPIPSPKIHLKCHFSGNASLILPDKSTKSPLSLLPSIYFYFCTLLLFSHCCVWLFATPWTAAARPPCPSLSPGVCSNSCLLSQWCHPTISSSVIPFSSCLQSFPASGSFPVSQLFVSGSQSIGASVSGSVLLVNSGLISFRIDWFDLLAVQGTLKSLLQHHTLKTSVLWHSAFCMVQLSNPYITTGKAIALTIWIFLHLITLYCELFLSPTRLWVLWVQEHYVNDLSVSIFMH